MERPYIIKLNAFEAGFLHSFLWKHKDEESQKALWYVMEQCLGIQRKIREQAGVKVEKLPNGLLKMTAADGTTIVREPYEWEKY